MVRSANTRIADNNGRENINVFTHEDCSGGSTFLWTGSGYEQKYYNSLSDWQMQPLGANMMSTAIPAGIKATFYSENNSGGESVEIIGEDDENGYPKCQSTTLSGAGAKSVIT